MTPPAAARPPRRSTLADVAALAQVDRSVVSRLINNDPALSIRESTRKRVLDAIAMLGYRPHAAARSLRTARTRTLGLLIPDFANPVYAEIIKGAEQAAAAVGSALVTGSASAGGNAQTYLSLLGDGRVDGLLLATGISTAEEAELARLRLPWLLLNRSGEGHRHVTLDDERAAAIAVEHLVALGHTRIGHLAGPRGADTARRRRAGYTRAVRRAGLAAESGLVVAADYTAEGGATAMTRLLRLPQPPTAVFVANVASAIGALHAAQEHRVRVPGDVSVIAVHDLPLAAYLAPPLTTVRMPLVRLGARAVELLLGSDPDAPITETVREPIELVLRDSTAPAGSR
ncbi:LacI family DNA-binding transcriptional regulator [Plantactinospora sp. WMMC1484]|uniref:LacI family DNA-binding transcriptional regulator n=1 Tax=Plantactinospora sp. WMMC1484 TaxID=3404122 RepID=UPI003BF6059B